MAWWGKALGGAFGFMMGGPLGALIGIGFGHNFDKGLGSVLADKSFKPGQQERVQAAFFTATFSVMGHIAKADGKVTPDEIRMAQAVMTQMGLTADVRESARRLFNEGKSDSFPLDEVLDQLKTELHRRSTLLQMFLEIQLQAAYADGVLHKAEEKVLIHICQRLGVPLEQLRRLEEMMQAGFGQGSSQSSARTQRSQSLEDAYLIVGVEKSVDDAAVKKAYRRLMSQHHPDKLVAKGLPEQMIKDATAKTQQIKDAYEQIKQSRGMR
ncbi:MAG: co-chaperone DjlA [Gammaproteobacteria bacterium]|nr:co-chaperone DjlA [Gammaproteobacteria bacterium]MBL6998741.1 co-chaperone DjlA [Gammaproteobacteria bacterium]